MILRRKIGSIIIPIWLVLTIASWVVQCNSEIEKRSNIVTGSSRRSAFAISSQSLSKSFCCRGRQRQQRLQQRSLFLLPIREISASVPFISSNAALSSSSSSLCLSPNNNANGASQPEKKRRRRRIRKRVSRLAPKAIASVLKDATFSAVDLAVDEVMIRRSQRLQEKRLEKAKQRLNGYDDDVSDSDSDEDDIDLSAMTPEEIIEEAFRPVEESLLLMEESLENARMACCDAKARALDAMETVAAASAKSAAAAAATTTTKEAISVFTGEEIELSALTYEDVNYEDSEMAPPFLDSDRCLIPGEPLVRVEKAPDNSRRIFAGIDILASIDDVWNTLTDYEKLQDVIPNLVVNEVLEEYGGKPIKEITVDRNQPDEQQCEELSKQLKGALLRQVGGAKVAGINFSARTKLEVREWPNGMPDFAHFADDLWEGKDRNARAKANTKTKLERYRFPRPFVVSQLPTRDISMQSIVEDDGEFRLYQGVWRMQPLVGCAPDGKKAMRLSYAVEISPRPYLPVYLVEGRIVRDLCTNLVAISDFCSTMESSSSTASPRTFTV